MFANKLNLILVANISGIIFFPLINGGTIMLSAVCSGIFFKEKADGTHMDGHCNRHSRHYIDCGITL